MEVLAKIIVVATEWLPAVTGLITACAAIAALTPTNADNKIIDKILKVINFIGINILKAENKDA